jgi:hypothetical protein
VKLTIYRDRKPMTVEGVLPEARDEPRHRAIMRRNEIRS